MNLKTVGIWIGTLLGGLCVAVAGTALWGLDASDAEVAQMREAMMQAPHRPHALDEARIAALPEPVRRYAAFALGERRSFPYKGVYWEESGVFTLPTLGRFSMEASQLSRTDSPHYLWRGYMRQAGGLWMIESRDYFSVDAHDMRAKIWGLKKVMHSDYDAAEEVRSLHSYLLLRYYGTALGFPWVLLSDPNVRWEPIDADHAWLVATHEDRVGRYRVWFESDGRISKMESPDFQLHGNGEYLKESAEKDGYVVWEGMRVPTRLTYRWVDAEGRETTYEFTIKGLRDAS